MSLRIWLPMTKDLRNQGLDDVAVTNNGATFNSAGKLGGCYSVDNVKQIGCNNCLNLGTTFSIAFWSKINSKNVDWGNIFKIYKDGADYIGMCSAYTTDTNPKLGFHIYRNNGSNAREAVVDGYKEYSLNNWFHTVITVTPTKAIVYKDGVVFNTFAINKTFPSITNYSLWLGKSGIGNGLDCSINDFRIYDHCLSPMEVKELAKGLVLHYPLSSADLINRSTITHGYFLNSNGAEGGDNGWCHTDYIGLIPNSSYIGIGLSAGGANTYAALYNKDKVLTRTVLLTANQNLLITTSDTEYFIRLSIRKYVNELNTTAKFLYVGTTEYDCSGFCNNGTRTGTFSWTSDTPKYSVSQDCLGTNYIYLTPPSTEVQTIAVWVNWKAIPSGQSVIFVDYGSGMGLGLMNTGILCSTSGAGSSYTFSKANLVANTWYHFVVVKTGTTTRKLYINGVEQTATSNTSNWSYSVNQLQLGKRSTTSDGFVGKLSDFRAYATALSADDVQSLYQNSAYIDSSGNVYGAVHSEV